MAISPVGQFGPANDINNTTTAIYTLATGESIASGSLIIVRAGSKAGTLLSSVADSKGNTYTVDQTQAGTGGSLIVSANVASSLSATTLVAGDTITATFASSNTDKTMLINTYSGAAASPVDKHAGASGLSTAPTVSTVATTQANELVVSCLVTNASSTITDDASYTNKAKYHFDNGTVIKQLSACDKIVSATGVQTHTASISGSQTWAICVVTYKAAAAGGGGGGSSSPFNKRRGVGYRIGSGGATGRDRSGPIATYPQLDEVSLMFDWNLVETSLGVFSWDPDGKLLASVLAAKAAGGWLMFRIRTGAYFPSFRYTHATKPVQKITVQSTSTSGPDTDLPVFWDANYQFHWQALWDQIVILMNTSLGDGSGEVYGDYCIGVPLNVGTDVGSEMWTLQPTLNTTIWNTQTATTELQRRSLMATVWTTGESYALANLLNAPVILGRGALFNDAGAAALAMANSTTYQAQRTAGRYIGMITDLIPNHAGTSPNYTIPAAPNDTWASFDTGGATFMNAWKSNGGRGDALIAMQDASWTGGPNAYTNFADAVTAEIHAAQDLVAHWLPNVILLEASSANLNAGGNTAYTTELFANTAPAIRAAGTASPTNTVAPTTTGPAKVGQNQSSNPGTWTGSPTFTYQWQTSLDSGASWSAIPGATFSGYIPIAGDAGNLIRISVTGTNAQGSATAVSSAAGPVNLATGPLNLTLPVVSGTLISGRFLTTTKGDWNLGVIGFAYGWQRSTDSGVTWTTSGVDTPTYPLTASDVSAVIRSFVVAYNADGATTAFSLATGVIGLDQSTVPPLNPPPAGEPATLGITTASPADKYDVVIDGIGYMLWWGLGADEPPSAIFKQEAQDMEYTPTFIPRTNVQGDFGDNTQDFFMTVTQRDWSGGEGQRYFRNQDPRSKSYLYGEYVNVTDLPGSVTMGIKRKTKESSCPANYWRNMVYTKETGSSTASPGDAMVRVRGTNTNTVVTEYSVNGGDTWTTQTVTGATIWHDCVDMVSGDDGSIYCLEAVSANSPSIIHYSAMPRTISTAWANTAALVRACHCINFYQGAIYVATAAGELRKLVGSTGVLSGSITEFTIHDFGGGTIIDMAVGGGLLWLLYVTPFGDYRLFSYDGSAITEAATLPRGWKMSAHTEAAIESILTPTEFSEHRRSVSAICYQDGVVYVVGLVPARDYINSAALSMPYRSCLWAFDSGNTSTLWVGDTIARDIVGTDNTLLAEHYLFAGGSGAVCAMRSGQIIFYDGPTGRIMRYDPATGGTSGIGRYIPNTPAQPSTTITTGLSGISGTTMVVADTSKMNPGSILGSLAGGEQVIVTNVNSATLVTVQRGYWSSATTTTFIAGASIVVQTPVAPIVRLEYDFSNHVLFGVNAKDISPLIDKDRLLGWAYGDDARWDFRAADLSSLGDTGRPAHICSSLYDLDSSLPKYFRSVMWDGVVDRDEGTSMPGTSTTGELRLYYRLDAVATTTTECVPINNGAPCLPGEFYDINATGRSLCIVAELKAPAPASGAFSVGPELRKVAVRGIPAQQAFRRRHWVIGMADQMTRRDGSIEPRTPAQMRTALEASMTSSAPVTVSDTTMSNVQMSFESDSCKVREIRPGEYACFIQMREV